MKKSTIKNNLKRLIAMPERKREAALQIRLQPFYSAGWGVLDELGAAIDLLKEEVSK